MRTQMLVNDVSPDLRILRSMAIRASEYSATDDLLADGKRARVVEHRNLNLGREVATFEWSYDNLDRLVTEELELRDTSGGNTVIDSFTANYELTS